MSTINLGVIGLGRMGRIFSRHLRRRGDGVRLAAVASRRVDEATRFLGEESGITLYTDLHDLVADPAIHGVVIASHTDEHKEAVLAAAAAGKAIFCEKPLALTLADVGGDVFDADGWGHGVLRVRIGQRMEADKRIVVLVCHFDIMTRLPERRRDCSTGWGVCENGRFSLPFWHDSDSI